MPKDEWIFIEGLIPPIVDVDLWQSANDAIAERAGVGKAGDCGHKKSNPRWHVLSGKLVCGNCRKAYYRTVRRGCSDRDKSMHEWKCSSYLQGGRKIDGCDNVHLEEKILFEILENVNAVYFQNKQIDKRSIIHKTIYGLEKVLSENKHEGKVFYVKRALNELRSKKQILLEKLLDGVISDEDYQLQNKKIEEGIHEAEKELCECCSQDFDQKNSKYRLKEIQDKLEKGGYERAITAQMLDSVQKIVVHEWQLEIIFKTSTLFVDIPFSPNTEKGRYLDRLRIMELLQAEPCITAKKIAAVMDRSPYMVWNRMQELKKDGYISYYGAGGKGIWKIKQEFPDTRVSKKKYEY